MPSFVELDRAIDSEKIRINPDFIVALVPREEGCDVVLVNANIHVLQGMDEVHTAIAMLRA